VTLDAAGCLTKIASQIVEQGADNIPAVKNKQPGLAKVVRESFESSHEQEEAKDLVDFRETQDEGHGRTEIRRCTVLKTDSNRPLPPAWKSVAAMVRIESERRRNDHTSHPVSYFFDMDESQGLFDCHSPALEHRKPSALGLGCRVSSR